MKFMYFDPNAFERIKDSITENPFGKMKYSRALVDSFGLFMLLQLTIAGHGIEAAFLENCIPLVSIRTVIAKSSDLRHNKKIKYLLEVLQHSGMIAFAIEKRKTVRYRIAEYIPTKLCVSQGFETELRKLVKIKKCNRRILEDYDSCVPFAIYCLMRSIQKIEYGKPFMARIPVKEIHERLNVSIQSVDKYKGLLQQDGLIYPIYSREYKASIDKGHEMDCNEYAVYDYDKRRPEKYAKLNLRKQAYKGRSCVNEKQEATHKTLG